MDAETKKAFEKTNAAIEKLATATAEGFADMRAEMLKGFQIAADDQRSLREELKSIRNTIKELPDEIDQTYGATINSIIDRVTELEKQVASLSS